MDTQGKRGSAPDSDIKGTDGAIFTGLYNNLEQLYDDDNHTIFDEKKRLNTSGKSLFKTKNESVLNFLPWLYS